MLIYLKQLNCIPAREKQPLEPQWSIFIYFYFLNNHALHEKILLYFARTLQTAKKRVATIIH